MTQGLKKDKCGIREYNLEEDTAIPGKRSSTKETTVMETQRHRWVQKVTINEIFKNQISR